MWSYSFLFVLILINLNINEISSNSLCKERACIRKCCGIDEYIQKRKLCNSGILLNYTDISVFDDKLQEIPQHISEIFDIIPGMFEDTEFRQKSFVATSVGFNTYLTKKSLLYLEFPNTYDRWIILNNTQFCVDYKGKTQARPVFYCLLPNVTRPQGSSYLIIALYVSCFFLMLVFIIYMLLAKLRNLGGKILMAYVASLFMSFLLLAQIQTPSLEVATCKNLTYSIYFFFLSAFCWMNIMSYDIWWTFRGYAKVRPIHRRGELFKFLMYCLYAWGVPLAMTIAFIYLNENDFRQYPWLVTPQIPRKGCFLEGGEKFLYLYVPMLIMTISNWIFYAMTAFNLWRLSRGTAVLDTAAAGTPQAHRTQRQRFMVYLKLSVVMGLNWLLEVVSFICPGLIVWYITDAYNIFIGISIFLIFCWKAKIAKALKKLFVSTWKRTVNRNRRWMPSSKSYLSSSSDSSASQETSLPTVCNDPNGPAYPLKVQ